MVAPPASPQKFSCILEADVASKVRRQPRYGEKIAWEPSTAPSAFAMTYTSD